MVRISKDHDVRKKEIMDSAINLFLKKSYENTSINAIIETVGIAKGTFYYYFKSKVELLDEIVKVRSDEIIDQLRPILEDNELNAIEKINRFFNKALYIKAEMRELLQTIYRVWMKDENLMLRYKMERRNAIRIAPELKKVIQQGVSEGNFELDFIDGVAEMILKLGTVVNDTILDLYVKHNLNPPAEEIINITHLYQVSIERILGAPKGSLKIFDTDALIKAVK